MTVIDAINILEEIKDIDDSLYQYNPNYMEALDIALQCMRNSVGICDLEELKESEYELESSDIETDDLITDLLLANPTIEFHIRK